MPYAPFHLHFPEIAKKETRSITVHETTPEGLPAGDYGFLELYCDEPKCDCRRVFFNVISRYDETSIAYIAYGWESPEFYARWMRDNDSEIIKELKGPSLNMASRQSEFALAALKLVEEVLLKDEAYIERLQRHYYMFRSKIDGKPRVNRKRRKRIKKKK